MKAGVEKGVRAWACAPAETSVLGLWSPVTFSLTLPSLLGQSLSFESHRPVASWLALPPRACGKK